MDEYSRKQQGRPSGVILTNPGTTDPENRITAYSGIGGSLLIALRRVSVSRWVFAHPLNASGAHLQNAEDSALVHRQYGE